MTTTKIAVLRGKIDRLARELEQEEAKARGPQPLKLYCTVDEGDYLEICVTSDLQTQVFLYRSGRKVSVILSGYDTEKLADRLVEFTAHCARSL